MSLCRGEHKSSVILSLYMVVTSFLEESGQLNRKATLGTFMHRIDLVSIENGSVQKKNSIMHNLNIGLTSFLGDFFTSEHMSFIGHFYAWY